MSFRRSRDNFDAGHITCRAVVEHNAHPPVWPNFAGGEATCWNAIETGGNKTGTLLGQPWRSFATRSEANSRLSMYDVARGVSESRPQRKTRNSRLITVKIPCTINKGSFPYVSSVWHQSGANGSVRRNQLCVPSLFPRYTARLARRPLFSKHTIFMVFFWMLNVGR